MLRVNTIFKCFFVVAQILFFAVSLYGQNEVRSQAELNTTLPSIEQVRAWKHKVYSAPQGTEAFELYSNGPLWNDDTPPAPIPAGSFGSELSMMNGYLLLGRNWRFTSGNSMADDFTNDTEWNIDSLVFYGFESGLDTTSTYTAVYVQIWNGPPDNAGSSVVWGDLTTNVLASTHYTNVYRYSDYSPDTTYPIKAVVVTPAELNLPAGTYWIQVSAESSAYLEMAWMPPTAYMGVPYNGNAKYHTANGWGQFFEYGAQDNLEIPFKIYGTLGASAGPGPAVDPSPVNGSSGIRITGTELSWTNSAPSTAVDLYFGTDLALVQGLDPSVRVSTGTLINSYSLGELYFFTPYYWRVVGFNGTGSTTNPVWTFKTMSAPSRWIENFEEGLGDWTVTNTGPAGSCVWEIDSASSYLLPPAASGKAALASSDLCGVSGIYPMSTWLTLSTPVNLSVFGSAVLEFDMDFHRLGVDTGLVEISPNGGADWVRLASFTADTRNIHQIYDVSSIAAGRSDVLLRFYYFADGFNWSFVIDNVSLYGTDTIRFAAVTAPNGGEIWKAGTSQSITWAYLDIADVKIEYSTDNGSSWSEITPSTPASSNSFPWVVPNTPSEQCIVRISDAANSGVADFSDAPFTIYNTQVAVISPNGGEAWKVGTSQSITWACRDIADVKIEYSTDNGSSWAVITASTPAANHAFPWAVPNTPSDQCKVRISDAADSGNVDVSSDLFTIFSPQLTVTSPVGGERWDVGTSQQITWSSSFVEYVRIEFSADNGLSWSRIVDTTRSLSFFTWEVPATPSSQCLIRIVDTADDTVADVSDSVFTIFDPSLIDEFESGIIPKEYQLYQNFPNPFNPSTAIYFDLPEAAEVRIVVFNILGQEIETLRNGFLQAGRYFAMFNGANLSSGLYYYCIETDKYRAVKKMIFVK